MAELFTVTSEANPGRANAAIRALYSVIWVVFLLTPLTLAATSDAHPGWVALAVGATIAFGAAYVAGILRVDADAPRPAGPRGLAAACLALAALAAATIPAIGPGGALTFRPYFSALVAFGLPARRGIPAAIALWALPATGYVAAGGIVWHVLGPGIGVVFIVVIRLAEAAESRARAVEEQKRLAEDRERVARDVHDLLGHSLTVVSLKAQLASRLVEADPQRARAELDEIYSLSRDALHEIRETVTRLREPTLESEAAAARRALAAAGIDADVDVSPGGGERDDLLAWALREAVTNVIRHSRATRCTVSAAGGSLTVADDGVGIDERSRPGFGIAGLKERAAAHRARLSVAAAYPDYPGTTPEQPGTRIEVTPWTP